MPGSTTTTNKPPRPEELIRPLDGPLLDRCVSDAARRLRCPIAALTSEHWYQPRSAAEDLADGDTRRGVPTLASWLVVLDTFGPRPGRCCIYDDGRHLATFGAESPAPPEFWMGVQERALPEASDPWWASVGAVERSEEGGDR